MKKVVIYENFIRLNEIERNTFNNNKKYLRSNIMKCLACLLQSTLN